jgi:isoleucyl-tRNA synthetase
VLSELHTLVRDVTGALQDFDAAACTKRVEAFVDDLSNWYVRRSRRRFWRGQLDTDKQAAYATLHHVLVKLGRVIAPITPFVTEVMYQNMVRSVQPNAYESVHMTYYPEADTSTANKTLLTEMDLARKIASLGLSARGGCYGPRAELLLDSLLESLDPRLVCERLLLQSLSRSLSRLVCERPLLRATPRRMVR